MSYISSELILNGRFLSNMAEIEPTSLEKTNKGVLDIEGAIDFGCQPPLKNDDHEKQQPRIKLIEKETYGPLHRLALKCHPLSAVLHKE